MIGLAILGFGVMGGLVYLGLFSPSVNNAVIQPENISYVLVNEDRGAIFNNQDFNLGVDFVYLINQDPIRHWHTASRSVATAGLRAGSYDVKIILPQNFSERLLALESFTPEQAKIIFEVRAGQNDLVNAAILESVGQILNDFNIRIIQMYFSSILNNIYEAQRNVELMIAGEQSLKNTLVADVHMPFIYLPTSFSSTIEMTEELSYQKRDWREQQEEFTEQTQEILENSSEELADHLEMLIEYAELQMQISQINLENAQAAIEYQSEADEAFYRGLFEGLHAAGSGQFQGLFADNEFGNATGILADLQREQDEFAENQRYSFRALQSQTNIVQARIDRLDELASDLATLREDIAEAYFSCRDLTPETASDYDVRRAIIDLAQIESVRESRLNEAYLTYLHGKIETLALDDIYDILEILYARGWLDGELRSMYTKALSIVERYAEQENLNTGCDDFSLLIKNDENFPQYSDYAEFDKMATFILSTEPEFANTTHLISIASISNITICPENGGLEQRLEGEIYTYLNLLGLDDWWYAVVNKLSDTDIEITLFHSAPPPVSCDCVPLPCDLCCICGLDPCECPPENCNCPPPTDCPNCPVITPNPLPRRFNVTTELTLLWNFTSEEKGRVYNSAAYTWHVNGVEGKTGRLCVYVNLYHPYLVFLREDFTSFLEQIQLLDSITRQIVLLFSPANENMQSIPAFYNFIGTSNGVGSNGAAQTIRRSAPQDSIYRSVGVLSIDEQRELISSGLLELFRAQGEALFNNVDEHYVWLQETILYGGEEIEELLEKLGDLPSPETLLDGVERLFEWQKSAREALSHSFGAWMESPIFLMQMEEFSYWNSDDVDDMRLFFDATVGPELFADFLELINDTIMHITVTQYTAAAIESLDYQFESLIEKTEQVKEDANAVLQNMDGLVDSAISTAQQNETFSDNFSEVMENARIGGVENRQLYQFLADPIATIGVFGAAETTTIIPYFMTIIGAVLSLAVGYSLRYVEISRKVREEYSVLTHSRIWFNTPGVVKTSAIAVVLGITYGVITLSAVPMAQAPEWIFYVGLVTLASILLVSFFARQFPKLALYIVLGFVGVYLLLTPILGMTIAPNSFEEILFQLSFLQNVEDGYMQLVQGIPVWRFTYIALCLLVFFGIVLNLLVKKREM